MLARAVITPLADIPAAPVVAIMATGVIIAITGHATRYRAAVAVGILILFLGTGLMIAFGFAAYQQNPTDPRPCTIAGC